MAFAVADKRWKVPGQSKNLIEFIVDSARRGRADSTPFHHLQFDRVFPDDFYSAMLQAMPASEDYRAMSGKTKMAKQPTRWETDSGQDRSLSRISSASLFRKARDLGCRGTGASFERIWASFHGKTRARAAAPVRRKLRQGAAVSSPDFDPRHPRLSRFQTHRQFVEGNHRPALSAAGQFDHAHRHDFSRAFTGRAEAQEKADAIRAKYRLRLCRG